MNPEQSSITLGNQGMAAQERTLRIAQEEALRLENFKLLHRISQLEFQLMEKDEELARAREIYKRMIDLVGDSNRDLEGTSASSRITA